MTQPETRDARSDRAVRQGHRIIVLALLLGAAAALRICAMVNLALDPDESEHLQAAWLIGQGQVPYVDFWDHHMPLFHAVIAPVTWWFGENPTVYFAGRALMIAATGAGLLLLYRVARRLDASVALVAIALLALLPRFLEKTIEVRPDVPALVAWLATVLALVVWRERGAPAWLWGAGLALGLAIVMNLKALYGAVGVTAVIIAAEAGPKPVALRRTLVALGRVVGGTALPLLALLTALVLARGPTALWSFVADVVGVNLRFVQFADKPWPVSDAGIGFAVLALGGIGLTVWREGVRVARHPIHGPLLIPLAIISAILWLPTTPGVARHAWLPVLAAGAVYASIALTTLVRRARVRRDRAAWGLAAMALLVGCVIPAGESARQALRTENREQLALMRLELTETCPDEPVLDGTALAVFRPPAHRYRTLILGLRLAIGAGMVSEAQLVEDLRQTRPRIAYLDQRLRGLGGPVADFIRSHYVAGSHGLLVVGAAIPASVSSAPARAEVTLLVGGPYRLSAAPGRTIAIDGHLTRPGFVGLSAGRHEVAWSGAPGAMTLTAATCAERRILTHSQTRASTEAEKSHA